MRQSKQSLFKTLALIKSDLAYRCEYEHKQLTALRCLGFMLNHSVISQMLFRWQVLFYDYYLAPIGVLLKSLNSIVFTVTIDRSTRIGPEWMLLHPNYINIGANVRIGKRCVMTQQVSIGPAYIYTGDATVSKQGPAIGDGVLIGVGSAIFGDLTIGSGSKISVNTAVDKSFPESSTLIGVPAKNRSIS